MGGRGESGGRKVDGDRIEGRVGFWTSTIPSVDARIAPRRLRLRDLNDGSFGRRRLLFFELFSLFPGFFPGEFVVSVPVGEG
jgi:hypothetical protein